MTHLTGRINIAPGLHDPFEVLVINGLQSLHRRALQRLCKTHEYRALLLDPDNLSMRYNLACSLARELGDPKGALETLKPFFEKVNSQMHIRHLEVDPDLDPIRKDGLFKEMLAAAKTRLGMDDPVIDPAMPSGASPA